MRSRQTPVERKAEMAAHLSRRTMLTGAGVATAAALTGRMARRTSATPARLRQSSSDLGITFWHGFTGARGETLQKLVDQFNAMKTGVTVTAQAYGSYEEVAQNLTRSLLDKTNPDIVTLSEALWFRFYLAGQIQPLDDLMTSTGFDTADLIPAFLAEGQRVGHTYWLPFSRSTPLVYYNRGMLRDAGLDAFPSSWQEFVEIAPKLVDTDKQVYAIAQSTTANLVAWAFQGVAWAFGGAYSDAALNILINQGGTIDAGRMYLQSIQDGWGYTTEQNGQDLGNGFAAATIASTGVLNDTATIAAANGIDLGTAFLPAAQPGGPQACPTGGSGFFIVNNLPAERQQAAFAFLTWAIAAEQTTFWAQNTGYMPVRTSAIQSEAMQQFFIQNPNFKTAVDQLPNARQSDTARTWTPGGDKIIADGVSTILVNKTDPQQAFDDVAAKLEDAAGPVRQQLAALEGGLGIPTTGTPVRGTPPATPIAAGTGQRRG